MEKLNISFRLSRFHIIRRLLFVVVCSHKAGKKKTNTIHIPCVEGLRCCFPLKPENLKVFLSSQTFCSKVSVEGDSTENLGEQEGKRMTRDNKRHCV